MHRVEILRKTFVRGQLVQPGDVVELDTPDYNAFLYMAKAKDAAEAVGGPPVADHREAELQRRLSKRGQPQPPPVEIVEPAATDDDDGGAE